MKDFFINLLDWIYKRKCYCCGDSKESKIICSKCYGELDFNPPQIDRNLSDIPVYVAGAYDKNLQKIIRGLKYHNKKDLAYYQAKFMYEYFEMIKDSLSSNFQVVPVPLHKKRQNKRGYNHMELVSDEFCNLSGFVSNYSLIKRVKNTKPQYKLTKKQRMENLNNAFEIDMAKYNNLPILLIDDICTSGATFEAIVNEFKQMGINNVVCFATTSPYS